MRAKSKNSTGGNYYSGGFAELVNSPSVLTYSFFTEWFTGNTSLGKAMKLLNLPYRSVQLPVLELREKELLVNLKNEEETLYRDTVFKYQKQRNFHDIPKLIVTPNKFLNPICIINTIKIIFAQSRWISNPAGTVGSIRKLVEKIPDKPEGKTLKETDEELKNNVWPAVIATGMLCEFYNQFLIKESKEKITEINAYISQEISNHDWFFLSVAEQADVKMRKLDFEEYIKRYRLRADRDYEFTCPRWFEIQEVIKKRIENSSIVHINKRASLNIDKKLKPYIDASIQLQILRSEAKKITLIYINQLRNILLEESSGMEDIGHLTKEDFINGKIIPRIKSKDSLVKNQSIVKKTSGKGIVVSQGQVTGIVKYINNNETDIPEGTVGIFPNASPEFAIQYPKCVGMIFLKGGLTSHGAIVAREFKIPAIIDKEAEGIKDGTKIELKADSGEWSIL